MAEEIKKEITKPSGKKFTLQVTYEPYYEQKASRRLTIHAKSEKGLLMALADNLSLYIDSEEIEEDKDFNVRKYIDEIEDGNGHGCDWISRLSINGKVYIDEVGEDEDREITVDESCAVKESEKMASKLDKEADKQVSTATKSLVSSDEIKDKEAQKILDKIHQYNGEDKVNEAVDTKGVTVGPFTSEETKKYSSELNDFCKQKDPDAYFETYWDVDFNHHNEPVISVDINWGDWKHEHLWFDELARQFFESKNIEIKIDTNVTEEDGSDTYSATHVIHKVGPSVTELTGDDAGNNVIMIKAKDTTTPVNEEEESH